MEKHLDAEMEKHLDAEMEKHLDAELVFGFIKPSVDAHTLGITNVCSLLKQCGYKAKICDESVGKAVEQLDSPASMTIIINWIKREGITALGFSYRLDPGTGVGLFLDLVDGLELMQLSSKDQGPLESVFFAGLPEACELVNNKCALCVKAFSGGESGYDVLSSLGVPEEKMPKSILISSEYDEMRWLFAEQFMQDLKADASKPRQLYRYSAYGTKTDSLAKRIGYCLEEGLLPITRAHVGPYCSNRVKAVEKMLVWCRELGQHSDLDVLSIGTSQLTQAHFGEDWKGLSNGGGVPVNSEDEYRAIKDAAAPMLVRTYSGTNDIVQLAKMHERAINNAWTALSLWWFCETDGRGANELLDNLKEHIEAIEYLASIQQPFEPNVAHHFAFRGCDDITYIVTTYIASKLAKVLGIKHLVIQNMLNTPRLTDGVNDLAKSRALLRLLRELGENGPQISLQTRTGLDYLSTNVEKAKRQLAASVALMDDIEPIDRNSPEIVHVVSYSEAIELASPCVVSESVQIAKQAIREYRRLKECGAVQDVLSFTDLAEREERLYQEARDALAILEGAIPDLYSANQLYLLFKNGFFPVPNLVYCRDRYPFAVNNTTAMIDGSVCVVDRNGSPLDTRARYQDLLRRFY